MAFFAALAVAGCGVRTGLTVGEEALVSLDSGSREEGIADARPRDAAPTDGGSVDIGLRDAGPIGSRDAEPADGGGDSGVRDAGPRDAGPHDAGPPDAGLPDFGPFDAGPIVCAAGEFGIAACTDGIDGDCDGWADCSDPDCRPLGGRAECCNGLDDDLDGTVDLFTCRCESDAICAGVGPIEQVCWLRSFGGACAPRCSLLPGWCQTMFGGAFDCDVASGECVIP